MGLIKILKALSLPSFLVHLGRVARKFQIYEEIFNINPCIKKLLEKHQSPKTGTKNNLMYLREVKRNLILLIAKIKIINLKYELKIPQYEAVNLMRIQILTVLI